MDSITLDQITLTPLKRMATGKGDVLHGMKATDPGFAGFGEVYFSWIEAGEIKAWKRHLRMTMNLIVPVGQVKFVFYQSFFQQFREETVGDNHYCRVTVPPGIWFGFMGLFHPQSLVTNLANLPHDPTEIERWPLTTVNYAW